MTHSPQTLLRELFDVAIAAADPATCIAPHMPSPPAGRTLLISAGKAAASMARAFEREWPRDASLSGIALTRYGHGLDCERIKVIEAAHPVPDNRGEQAARAIMKEVKALTEEDLLVFLVSGGGSALMTLPVDGISSADKQAINTALLRSGAPIGDMNTVRKHLSAIKGGRLAQAAQPARVVTLAISDVPHDDPSTIASGPTVPDPTMLADVSRLIARYDLPVTEAMRQHLVRADAETPKPGDPVFNNTEFHLVATPGMMIHKVEEQIRYLGLDVVNLGADLEGEAREVGCAHADMALQKQRDGFRGLIISGGETTVTLAPGIKGRGGRNGEYLLGFAARTDGAPSIHALACDTDGIDGSETNAGAIYGPDTVRHATANGWDAKKALDAHDAYGFFQSVDALIETGPTLTNVNDFRAIWIGGDS